MKFNVILLSAVITILACGCFDAGKTTEQSTGFGGFNLFDYFTSKKPDAEQVQREQLNIFNSKIEAAKKGTNCNIFNDDYVVETIPHLINETTPSSAPITEDKTKVITEEDWKYCAVQGRRPLSALDNGSKKFIYTFDGGNQQCLGLFGLANLGLSEQNKILIVDYVEYKDTTCTAGSQPDIRLSAGVRLVLTIHSNKKKVNIKIPAKVAAAAEFDLAETTFQIETIGFVNDDTRRIIGNLGGDFNVESYIKVVGAVGEIMKVMKDDMMVSPTVLPI